MLQKFTLLFTCLLLIAASSGKFKSENKEITQYYVPVPAKDGTHPGFFISSIEITNRQYRDFLNDLKAKGETEKLKRAKVDTGKWEAHFYYNDPHPFESYYFQHPAYDNYPVVNISKEGAILYCAWLTEKYNAKAKMKVRFALPTEEQWILAATAGDASAIYGWKGNSMRYEKKGPWYNKLLGNFKQLVKKDTSIVNNPNANITAPSLSYMPNAYGIYNMSGNVAELLADKDYTKGGSWSSPADKVAIAAREEFTGSAPTIGFRPVMVITNEK
jgi:sulfatase modifying factor 1